MQQINIDANVTDKNLGRNGLIKDINGVNGTPISFMPGFPDLQDQFNQLGVSHVRLHDIFGPGDIENDASTTDTSSQLLLAVPSSEKKRAATFIADMMNKRAIFPHANEGMRKHDKTLAASEPNWAPTDYYINKTMQNIESLNPGHIRRDIMFRIGRSFGGGANVPADIDIYADLIGEAVKRYSADISLSGIPRKIAYWEIWNEPDLLIFWGGNAATFYEMYEKVARKIKSIDPTAKVGGPGVADGENGTGVYTKGLVAYCQKNNVPLDFLSWHYYAHMTTDPGKFATCAKVQRTLLDRYGFKSAESICSEWNITPFASVENATKVQTPQNAAFIAASFITMNRCSVDKAYYYRGDAGFLGLFNEEPNYLNPKYNGFSTYAAQAFGLYKEMFGTPNLLASPDYSNKDFYILSGRGTNAVNVLVAHFRKDVSLAAAASPPPNKKYYRQYYVDSGRKYEEITDDWSREHWLGEVKADENADDADSTPPSSGDTPSSAAPTDDPASEPAAPVSASPFVKATSNGVIVTVKNLPTRTPLLEVRRVKDKGNLGVILPIVDNRGVTVKTSGTTITITDPNATDYTVSHYSIIW